MTDAPSLTLCIVNYNGAAHLGPALQALDAQDWQFAEILLVDDASEDGSVEIARAISPGIRIIALPVNRGPAAARNAGFRDAANDLVLFQDNDVRLQPGTVQALVDALRSRDDALLATPRVRYADDPARVQYESADCHFLGLMAPRNADAPVSDPGDTALTTSMVSACFLIDRGRWQSGELFDDAFGFNLEDHDLGVRATLLGHSLLVVPRAGVLHGSGTPGLSWRPGRAAGDRRLYHLTLNRWIVVSKCFAARTLAWLFPALLLYELMQLAWYIGNRRAGTWFRALRAYLRSLPRIRQQRRLLQRTRATGDRDILCDLPLPFTTAVRSGRLASRLIDLADRVLRGYWRLIRRRI